MAGIDQFTQRARRVLSFAHKEAAMSHTLQIGTEHLLVGLVREWEGTAGKILEEYGVTDQKLIELIRELIAPPSQDSPSDPSSGETAGTPPAAVLEKEPEQFSFVEQLPVQP